MQNLSQRAWRNQGRYEGDWGVHGKILTSGPPQDGRTLTPPHNPTPHTQYQYYMPNFSRRIWRTKAGMRVIGVSMERYWPQGHHTMDGPTPQPPTTTATGQHICSPQGLTAGGRRPPCCECWEKNLLSLEQHPYFIIYHSYIAKKVTKEVYIYLLSGRPSLSQ